MKILCGLPALFLAASVTLGAQTPETFKARLGTVPVEAATLAGLTGASGAVTVVLTGTKLSVNGTFKGLQSPATVARLHAGPMGQRGPAMLDLAVTKATSGTINGDLVLTPVQADHLRRKRVYVQVHSEKAPEGHLWGWLLP